LGLELSLLGKTVRQLLAIQFSAVGNQVEII
jgi:hypothetical protein